MIPLFESLDRLEKMLEGGKEFIAGDKLTEADVRLYTTLVSSVPSKSTFTMKICTTTNPRDADSLRLHLCFSLQMQPRNVRLPLFYSPSLPLLTTLDRVVSVTTTLT